MPFFLKRYSRSRFQGSLLEFFYSNIFDEGSPKSSLTNIDKFVIRRFEEKEKK